MNPGNEPGVVYVPELRTLKQRTTWYVLAREYIEQRCDRTPGNTRRTLADALATITPAFVEPELMSRAPRELRRALYSWAFNKNAWKADPPEEWQVLRLLVVQQLHSC